MDRWTSRPPPKSGEGLSLHLHRLCQQMWCTFTTPRTNIPSWTALLSTHCHMPLLSARRHFCLHLKWTCPKMSIDCPNGCTESIIREELGTHREICLLEIIECPFIGCEEQVTRRDLPEHKENASNTHLLLLHNKVMRLQSEIYENFPMFMRQL